MLFVVKGRLEGEKHDIGFWGEGVGYSGGGGSYVHCWKRGHFTEVSQHFVPHCSLWRPPTFCDPTRLFPAKKYLRNDHRNFILMICLSSRLRVAPHVFSGIVERAKRERAWKSPHARKAIRVGWFFTRARVSFALLSLRKTGGLLVVYHSPDLGT